MDTLRFGLLSVGLFVLTFVGISWGAKGFPIMTMRIEPLKPNARFPTFEEHLKAGLRKDWENSKTNQSDNNRGRDKLRRELLQASTAYELSPCNDAFKSDLIKALTDYTQAWHDLAYCRLGVDGCPGTEDSRSDAAVAAFKTPADVHLHMALRKAMDQGGVSLADFPYSLRNFIFMWSDAPHDEPKAICRQARNPQ